MATIASTYRSADRLTTTTASIFFFSPDAPVPQAVESFRKAGVGQQMSDGTFDFVVRPKVKSRSVLIRKLAHGRISRTRTTRCN